MLKRALSLLVFLSLTACMSDLAKEITGNHTHKANDMSKPLGSCSRPWPTTGTYCEETISVSGEHSIETRKNFCEALGGTFASGPCNRDVSSGTCELRELNSMRGIGYYPDSITPETAKLICDDDGGTFTALK